MLIGKDGSEFSAHRGWARRAYGSHPLETGIPPLWASEWGDDLFGPFVAFAVGGVQQRLRWIPPGRFTMGSPQDEPGRYGDEGPQHEVTLSEGFWLADTTCTQALWQTVIGDNPSRFRSAQRPVEQISWQDARRFLERLNACIPGLAAALPTEAQWEYACRAHTTTTTYGGSSELSSVHDTSVLDAIAWYADNSAVGFELTGVESPGSPETAYEHGRAGTHPVALKGANPFGLYDMLGNVWEWCADYWDKGVYTHGPITDPRGPELGDKRAIRGGSWNSYPRHVRAAYRRGWPPDSRANYTGLRLARGALW